MNGYLLNILGYLGVRLRVVADRRRVVLSHRDPDGLSSLDNHALGLHRAGVCVHDHVLDKAGDVAVIPAGVAELVGLLAGPGCKGVRAVVGPSPETGRLPGLRHAHADRNHLLTLGQRRGAEGQQAGADEQERKELFHSKTSISHFNAGNRTLGK